VLRQDDLRALSLLREKCTSLTTLETYVHSKNSRGLTGAACDPMTAGSVGETLCHIDARLKAIPSLREVRVRLYDGPLAPGIEELLRSFGWVILPGR
jgi:hypothetical protein